MKEEKQEATVNCLNFMSKIRWFGTIAYINPLTFSVICQKPG